VILLVLAGFLIPFWSLAALAVVAAAFLGEIVMALILGLLLDLVYGAPTGTFSFLLFPFTLLALLCVVGERTGVRMLFDRSESDTL